MLPYGWWEFKFGKRELPKYLGEKRNFVLTVEELEKYAKILLETRDAAQREFGVVQSNIKALKVGRVPGYESPPRCTTLAHLLGYMVQVARQKLAIMQFCTDVLAARREKNDG